MSPTLGIDGHRLVGARSGVGRYIAELLREWADTETEFGEIVVFAPEGVAADALPPKHSFRVHELSGAGGAAFHWGLGRAARHVDLLFAPRTPLRWLTADRSSSPFTTHSRR